MNDNKTLKRLLAVLFIIIVAVALLALFLRNKPTYELPVQYTATPGEIEEVQEEDPFVQKDSLMRDDSLMQKESVKEEIEDDPFKLAEVPERYIVDHHRVVEDESFSLITGMYWDDIYLWPDLYIRNQMISDDPDIIYSDEIIDIYNRLGYGDNYNPIERDQILKAYIEVYDIYKGLGKEKENSVWALLYSGAKYDHNFLELFRDRIDPKDRAMAQKYIDEEGFLD